MGHYRRPWRSPVVDRQNFGVSWQDTMDRGGIVVGNEIDIVLDVEAILEDG